MATKSCRNTERLSKNDIGEPDKIRFPYNPIYVITIGYSNEAKWRISIDCRVHTCNMTVPLTY